MFILGRLILLDNEKRGWISSVRAPPTALSIPAFVGMTDLCNLLDVEPVPDWYAPAFGARASCPHPFILSLSKDLHLSPFVLSLSKDSPFHLPKQQPSQNQHTSRTHPHLPPFILSLSKDARLHLPSLKPPPTSIPTITTTDLATPHPGHRPPAESRQSQESDESQFRPPLE